MSSTALKQHITQLVSDLTRCYELCDAILENRRTGNKHESLDRLQAGFSSSANAISIQFKTLRKLIGSRMDLGDDIARRAIKANIKELELGIEQRLDDIASRRTDGLPGFRDMLRSVQRIEESVSDTLETLSQRLQKPVEKKPAEKKAEPKPEKKKTEEKKKPDDIIISEKKFEKYTDHMKNSWAETIVAGKILYVNQWDEKKNQWEKPVGGFIKSLPTPARAPQTPTVEVPEVPRRRPAREEPWEVPEPQRRPAREPAWDFTDLREEVPRRRPAREEPRDYEYRRSGWWQGRD